MRYLAYVIAMLWCTTTAAQAQAVYNKPLLDPSTGSYFELLKVNRAESEHAYHLEISAHSAKRLASQRNYNGAQGRLAVIRSYETHIFLLENIRPDVDTWIGLGYYCKERQLRWVNGEVFQPKDFQVWHAQWDQSGPAGCLKGAGEGNIMPVKYLPVHKGFRWAANGYKKHWNAYLVEYPAKKK